MTELKQTKIVVSDRRVIIVDHADSKAACFCISVAAQSAARVLGAQGYLARTVEIDPNRPLFDMEIVDSLQAKQGLCGLLDTIHKIAQEFHGNIVVNDSRSEPVEVCRPSPEEAVETTESFADEFLANREFALITDSQGRPIKSAA